jgi:wobble nucleotide-excising tRNase
MIEKIVRVRNVGLFENATPNGAVKLAQATGIFADNGRGKSTFAAVLRGCSSAEAGPINARKTIDSQGSPEVSLLVQSGGQSLESKFDNNVWAGPAPSIAVFDSEFVEENVYSGFEVRADQRQSLLEFALGDQTVQLKKQVDKLGEEIDAQTKKRKAAEKVLSPLAAPYTLAEFIALQKVPDAEVQIANLRKRIEAAKSAQQLLSRQDPSALPLLGFDVSVASGTLQKQLGEVEASAEALVRQHLAKHGAAGLEDWVSRGQEYLRLNECPFCGQPLSGIPLISAYRSFFNKAYSDLKRDVSGLADEAATQLGDAKVDALRGAVATNTARIEAWKDQLDLSVPTLQTDMVLNVLTEVRGKLLGMIGRKQQAPLEAIGSQADFDQLSTALAGVTQAIVTYNSEMLLQAKKICERKRALQAEDPKLLQAEVSKLEAAQRRQLPGAITAVADYQAADNERKRLDEEKTRARGKADSQMQITLKEYQTAINDQLSKFGAEFSIEQLKSTYAGGEPRTEYVLKIRSRTVKLGSRADAAATHCFATVLGDGDKRTLALAFFLARLKTDPQTPDKIVVLDDPVSSLDHNRRQESISAIALIAARCRQTIVLSNDRFFVRDFRNSILDLKPSPPPLETLTIKRGPNGYSAFAPCDIDDVCSSEYFRHHRLVSDDVDGKSAADPRDVAKAIRPLLEGYYHRRFPGLIPKRTVFGKIIGDAQQAQVPNPLANLKPLIPELSAINDYAARFHHDTNLAADTAPVTEGELLTFTRRTLDLIYQNG